MTDPTASPFSAVAGYPDQVLNPTAFPAQWNVSGTSLIVTWDPVENARFYEVFYGLLPQNMTLQGADIPVPVFTNNNLSPSVVYYGQVVAYFSESASIASVPVQFIGGVPVPTFDPPGGTYYSTQTVSILSIPGATIYYTVDGSTPTTSSTLYTGPVSVENPQTLKAIAVFRGQTSGVGTAVYNLILPAGTVQFTSMTYTADLTTGSANLAVSRLGGSTGAIGVSYATSNGTARAGIEYIASSGTLSWADADTANKNAVVNYYPYQSFSDDFETGNLSKWSYVSGGAAAGAFTITTSSPIGGTYSLLASAIGNIVDTSPSWPYPSFPGSREPIIQKALVPAKYQTFTAKFRINASGTDDAFTLFVFDSSQNIITTFIARRELAQGAGRRVWLNGVAGTVTLSLNVIYRVDIQFDWVGYTTTASVYNPSDVLVTTLMQPMTYPTPTNIGSFCFLSAGTNPDTTTRVTIDDVAIVFSPAGTVNVALSSPTGGASLGSPSSAVLTIQP